MSVGRFLAGVLVGSAIGAIAGILLAPQEGEKTREMIKDFTGDVAEKTSKTVKEIQEKADNIVSDMQTKSDEIMGQINDLLNRKKEQEV